MQPTYLIYDPRDDEFSISRNPYVDPDIRPEIKNLSIIPIMLHTEEEKVRMATFMNIGDRHHHKNKVIVPFDNLYIVFSRTNKAILFKDINKYLGKETKTYNTLSKAVKTWYHKSCPYTQSDFPVDILIHKFKGNKDFVYFTYHTSYLKSFMPEIFVDDTAWNGVLSGTVAYFNPDYVYETLYNEFEPYNLSNSYDYSEETKARMKREQEIREEIQERINEEKLAKGEIPDGYCEICGSAFASFVADPYEEEIYGDTTMRWLCDDCYNDLCMDI